MYSVLIEIFLSYFQYLTLLLSVQEHNFPSVWTDSASYFSLTTLDIDFWSGVLTFIPTDSRTYFMVVSVVLPLTIIFIGLLSLNSKRVVIWYFILVASVVSILAGALARIISSSTSLYLDSNFANLMMIAGSCGVVICFLVFLADRYWKRDKQAQESNMSKQELIESETKDFPIFSTIERGVYVVVGTVIGLFLVGVFDLGFYDSVRRSGASGVIVGIGVLLLLLAAFNLVWLVLGCFVLGRRFQWLFEEFLSENVMRVLLAAISFIYIPVSNSTVLMFNCNVLSCGRGYRLPDDGSAILSNITRDRYCQICVVASQQVCPSSLSAAICAGMSQSRMENGVHIGCNDLRTFFWPAAGLSAVVFTLGVMVLYTTMIWKNAKTINEEFPVEELQSDTPETKWGAKMASTSNVAALLFFPFDYRYRFWRLLQIVQKLIIVVTASYVFHFGVSTQSIALYTALVVHFVSLVLHVLCSPFVISFEDLFNDLSGSLLSACTVLAVVLLEDVNIPVWVCGLVLVLAVVAPVALLFVGVQREYKAAAEWESMKRRDLKDRVKQQIVELKQERADAGATIASNPPPVSDEDNLFVAGDSTIVLSDATVRASRPVVPHLVPMADEDESSPRAKAHQATPQPSPQASPRPDYVNGNDGRVSPGRLVTTKSVFKLAVQRAHTEQDDEAQVVQSKQEDVDLRTNTTARRILNLFFMGGGLVCLVALGCCVLGLMSKQTNAVIGVDETLYETVDTDFHFAGYASFTEFTLHCCCLPYENPLPFTQARIEKWVCENGKVKERLRAVRYLNRSGYEVSQVTGFDIRPMCAVTFHYPALCFPYVSSDRLVSLNCSLTNITAESKRMW